MWDRYHNVSLMLAAYNAGPGRANDYAAGRRSLPAETVNYVAQIAPGLGMASIASPAAMPTANAHPWRQATLFTPRGDGEASSTDRSEEHASELQSLMRSSYAVFCLKNKTQKSN